MAFTWACERLADYLVGLTFHIITDHKPLVPLFSSKKLDELPLRVQRFRLQMMRYDFTISHVPGKDLVVANTLSRAPARRPTENDQALVQEANAFVNLVTSNLPATEQRLQKMKQHQANDAVCQQLSHYCQSGWPERKTLPAEIQPYSSVSSELSVEDGYFCELLDGLSSLQRYGKAFWTNCTWVTKGQSYPRKWRIWLIAARCVVGLNNKDLSH